MALAESQCYTIINTPELSDVFNEMKIKKDLGTCAYFHDNHFVSIKIDNNFRQIQKIERALEEK